MVKSKFLNQKHRIIVFCIYLLLLWGINLLVTGELYAKPGSYGMWFYAIIFYILLHLIIAPFFKTPKDVLANTFACLVFVLSFEFIDSSYHINTFIIILYWVAVVYLLILLVLAILAIISKDSKNNTVCKVGKAATKFCSAFGKGKIEFSFVVLLSIFGYHMELPFHIWTFLLFWIFVVTAEPIEILWQLIMDFVSSMPKAVPTRIGKIKAYENPSLGIAILEGVDNSYCSDILWLINDSNAIACLNLCRNQLGDESWFRILITGIRIENCSIGGEGEIFDIEMNDIPSEIQEEIKNCTIFNEREKLLGFVAEGSHLSHINFDIIKKDVNLYEGRLLKVPLGDADVIYQITDATLRSESLFQKNTEGFARGLARKVGIWDSNKERFDVTDWLPEIYAPVFICEKKKTRFSKKYVGFVPGSEYRIKWDPRLGVTHNTAILGILGIGKSFLAYELIARMIKSDINVLCLDITSEYIEHLDDMLNSENFNSRDRIDDGLSTNRNNINNVRRLGGNCNDFRSIIKNEIRFLLHNSNPEKLRIWNPEHFDVTKQAWQGENVIVPLTPVEVTRIISESALEIVKEKGLSVEKAKLCLVFEEAHSLIPEWSSVSFDSDKQASNATAKAIMQGRKYGMGCLVITQRTANVIKSVLNQSNTIFALRVFDATGMEFLRNYIGDEYTRVLTCLKDRHAVLFGRASSSNQPLIVQLNDRTDFLAKYTVDDYKEMDVPSFDDIASEFESETAVDNDEDTNNSEPDTPF